MTPRSRRGKEYDWRHYLPRAKAKRGRRSRKGAVSRIPQRQGLEARPPEVATRQTFGHWEADLMLFSAYGQAVLALHERRSRLLLAWRLPEGKAAEPIARAIGQVLGCLPAAARQSVTFDNGSEFARHYRLHDQGIATYFCDPPRPLAEGRGGKRHWPAAPPPAAAHRFGRFARRVAGALGAGL